MCSLELDKTQLMRFMPDTVVKETASKLNLKPQKKEQCEMAHRKNCFFFVLITRHLSFQWRFTAYLLLIALLTLTAAAQFGCATTNGAANFAHVPASVFFDDLADQDGILLDIRTPKEFASGHIPGAVLMDYKDPTFRSELTNMDRSVPYFIYCGTGYRTRQAMRLFKELDFTSVVALNRGFGGLR